MFIPTEKYTFKQQLTLFCVRLEEIVWHFSVFSLILNMTGKINFKLVVKRAILLVLNFQKFQGILGDNYWWLESLPVSKFYWLPPKKENTIFMVIT